MSSPMSPPGIPRGQLRRRRTRFVIVFAGCTHTTARWLDGLAENGRLLLPLTTEDWSGFLLRVVRRGTSFDASSTGGVSIYPCKNGRDEDASRRLKSALESANTVNVPIRALHRGNPSSARFRTGLVSCPWLLAGAIRS